MGHIMDAVKMTSQKRFVSYCRVSTIGQVEGTSLDRQEEQNRALVEQNGGQIVASFRESVSGGLYFARKKFQQAIEMIERGEADGLVLLDLERFARDAALQEIAVKRITKAGGTILFCRDEFSNSPEGRLNRTLRGGVNQYFREKRAVLCADGLATLAVRGFQPNRNKFPYGYRIINKSQVKAGTHKGPAGIYEVVPEQAKWITKIYEWRVNEMLSLKKIAQRLKDEGAPSMYGGQWCAASVRQMIRNPVYMGQAAYKRSAVATDDDLAKEGKNHIKRTALPREEWISIPCPAIVTVELWNDAQKVDSSPVCKVKRKGRRRVLKVALWAIEDLQEALNNGDIAKATEITGQLKG